MSENFHVPYYLHLIFENYLQAKRKHDQSKILINILYYELSNVKGIDYTKEKGGSYSEDARIEKYYAISDRIREAEQEEQILKAYIKSLDRILRMVKDEPIREQIRKGCEGEIPFSPKY